MSTQQQIKCPDLSIVIPAYREEKRIGTTLDKLAMFLANDRFWRRKRVEILVVAADAPDKTQLIVHSKAALFSQQHIPLQLLTPGVRVGKGRDVRYGVLLAQGDAILYMDADLATPLYHIEHFYKACMAGDDVVIGTRNLLRYRANPLRNLFARSGNTLYQLVGDVQVEDTQCGFKMFSQKAAQYCFLKLTILGWGFDLELLTIAKINSFTIRTYRINDWEDKPHSTYTDGLLNIALRSVRDLVHIEINKLRGRYAE